LPTTTHSAQWINQYPATDGQQLRALIRQARKDAKPEQGRVKPRATAGLPRLFQMVREQMTPAIPDNIDSLANPCPP
jgi:ribosome-associated protein